MPLDIAGAPIVDDRSGRLNKLETTAWIDMVGFNMNRSYTLYLVWKVRLLRRVDGVRSLLNI